MSAALLTAFVLSTAPVSAQGNTVRQGVLTCRTSASVGLLVGSRQRLRCQFKSESGRIQNYIGTIGRLGLDIGVTAGGVMAGEFVGANGDVSVGLGVGANLLVGGTRKSVSLQPLSVEGQVGVNLALGVARMRLKPVS